MDAKSRANFINSVASGENVNNASAFESMKEPKTSIKVTKYVEPNNVFAQGLPEWSIEPPQIMVRRH